ncbi:disulfide bond formation protein B [Stenoxybacter acetivorans]|uniref:disulfide bond formation protein B n=1 Tax=Stenoxybacter acetivorans TaxID=422441 RepID=UPI000563026F|nr:disulfide bond formation protein B [Stenoxybacter acetivorans]
MMTYRKALFFVFLMTVAAVMVSCYLQYVQGMNPCVLCIVQRVAVIFTGLIALLCLLLPLQKPIFRGVAAMASSLVPIGGLGVALYQIYIQSLPITEQPSCGAPWTFRLQDAPLFHWYEPIIRGTGNCGEVLRLFGLSLPTWSALFFTAVLAWLWLMLKYTRK